MCNKLKKLDFKFKITLRLRFVDNEIDSKVIDRILNKCQGVINISRNKFLEDDIASCDCLLALSSTTLEQAIYYNLPSMSFGFSDYNHFDFYERNNKYRINSELKNYTKLKKIAPLFLAPAWQFCAAGHITRPRPIRVRSPEGYLGGEG